MQIFGLFCAALYCLASVIVGVRLVRLAHRTRELPELLIGCGLLTGGILGYGGMVATAVLASGSSLPAWPAAAVASLGLDASAACMLLIWWKIYHPASRWGPWVVSAWMVLLVVVLVSELIRSIAGHTFTPGPWESLRIVAQGGTYAAVAWSGFRYHARLRRRMRILRTDPVVINRILLWNFAASTVALQHVYTLAVPFLNSLFDAEGVAPAFIGSTGVIIALCITYAFYPPPGYLRWIKARHEREVG